MNLQFWKRQPVETRDYSVTTRDAMVNQALAEVSIKNSRPAILEAVGGLWARGFASATVQPETPATAALTPQVLATIGRRLFEKGEVVFEIQVTGGEVRLVEASSWDVEGTSAWTYRLTIPQPDAVLIRHRPADAVVHLRYGGDASQPWHGKGPIQASSTSRDLARALELRLSQEASSAVGNLIPTPDAGQDSDLQADLNAMKGGNALVPSTRSEDWAGGKTPPRGDWDVKRLGAAFPASLEPMRAAVSNHIAAAAGVPSALLAPQDATALRESWRVFLFSTAVPVGKLVAQELAIKLETPGLTFDWSELHASDIQGRARAFGSMVTAGMEIERAAVLSGLLNPEDGNA